MSIQEKYDTFVRENKCTPTFATASVRWKDTDEVVDNLAFSIDDSVPDDDVFFNISGVYELETLSNKDNGEDFTILDDTIEFYK